MTRIVDLSPTVPEGFHGPPSTDLGLRFDVRTKPGGWRSSQASLSVHTGCHVESELHVAEGGRAVDALALDSVIGSAVVLDLTPVSERALIGAGALDQASDALEKLALACPDRGGRPLAGGPRAALRGLRLLRGARGA